MKERDKVCVGVCVRERERERERESMTQPNKIISAGKVVLKTPAHSHINESCHI